MLELLPVACADIKLQVVLQFEVCRGLREVSLALRGRLYLSGIVSKFEPRDSLVYFHTGMYQDWNLIHQDTAAQAKIEEEQRAEREAKERLDPVWKSISASGPLRHFSATTRPDWHAGIAMPASRRRVNTP